MTHIVVFIVLFAWSCRWYVRAKNFTQFVLAAASGYAGIIGLLTSLCIVVLERVLNALGPAAASGYASIAVLLGNLYILLSKFVFNQ
jgi:hypothetical protein